jgi:hypothetical protein
MDLWFVTPFTAGIVQTVVFWHVTPFTAGIVQSVVLWLVTISKLKLSRIVLWIVTPYTAGLGQNGSLVCDAFHGCNYPDCELSARDAVLCYSCTQYVASLFRIEVTCRYLTLNIPAASDQVPPPYHFISLAICLYNKTAS